MYTTENQAQAPVNCPAPRVTCSAQTQTDPVLDGQTARERKMQPRVSVSPAATVTAIPSAQEGPRFRSPLHASCRFIAPFGSWEGFQLCCESWRCLGLIGSFLYSTNNRSRLLAYLSVLEVYVVSHTQRRS